MPDNSLRKIQAPQQQQARAENSPAMQKLQALNSSPAMQKLQALNSSPAMQKLQLARTTVQALNQLPPVLAAWAHGPYVRFLQEMADSPLLKKLDELHQSFGAAAALPSQRDALVDAAFPSRRERIKGRIRATNLDPDVLTEHYANALLRTMQARQTARRVLREFQLVKEQLDRVHQSWQEAIVQVSQSQEARRRGGKQRHAAKHKIKEQVHAFWLEWKGGRYPKLRTTDQFAMRALERWSELRAISTVIRWSTEWNKAYKQARSAANQNRVS